MNDQPPFNTGDRCIYLGRVGVVQRVEKLTWKGVTEWWAVIRLDDSSFNDTVNCQSLIKIDKTDPEVGKKLQTLIKKSDKSFSKARRIDP